MITLNRFWMLMTSVTLGATLSLWYSWVRSQTIDKTNTILENTVQACDADKECTAKKEDFLKTSILMNLPKLQFDSYDKQKIQEAFSLGWQARKNTIKPLLSKRSKWKSPESTWDQETINFVNGDAQDVEWQKAKILLEIDSYRCIKQCTETRIAVYRLLQYVFDQWFYK